ncbi:MAG: AMP-binding protein [Stappiaceae bacterium]
MSGSTHVDSANDETFPGLLLRNAKQWPDRPAMREKDLGIWQSWTWQEVEDEIRRFAIGLSNLGLKAGDAVAIIGSNRPRLYWSIVAVQSLGAIPVPVYADSVAKEMVFVLEHADVNFAICEDQEQVDKVLSLQDQLPKLAHLIYDEERGLRDYDHSRLHNFESVQLRGQERLAADPAISKEWQKSIAGLKSSDVAVILYTSGTTGKPKGVLLTYENLVVTAKNANAFEGLNERDETLAYLPLAWVGDHVFSLCQSYTAGYCVNCPESLETVAEDRREIAPTYFFAPPRVFEDMLTTITVDMEDAGRPKRKMFDFFMAVARRSGEKILNGDSVAFSDRILYFLGEYFVYGPLKNHMGFSRVRVSYTAGEAIGPEIFSFYRSLGLNLKQLYGQTEGSVFVTIQPDGAIRADTVGPPATDVEIRIADDGEVLYKSPGVFLRYFKNEEATRETKTEDGWMHTGDAGFFTDEGHLKIIDRAKDVGKLNSGSMFAPKYIENKLKFFPNIKEVVAFGHEKEFCAAFINIDLVAVGNWAERNNIAYASYQELAAHPEVYKMIESHVDQVNRDLSNESMMSGAQIQRFLILHKELDADDGELTRTQKVRRTFISDRYGPLIDAFYDGSPSKHIRTEVTFEDGRKGILEATIEIRQMKPYPEASDVVREAAE